MAMLSIPQGFNRSVTAHNSDYSAFLDWIEMTSLICQDEFSPTDVVDCLIEEQIYDEQDFAMDFVESGWTALKTRLSWLEPNSPISFTDRWMARQLDWTDVPAHIFCLTVSFGPHYSDWHAQWGPDYNYQSELFELVTQAAMTAKFMGWSFLHTGWSRDNTSRLVDVVSDITAHIGERDGLVADYASVQAKDGGVDLVWHLPFADARGGAPVYLVQCASGKGWESKIGEPNLGLWTKLIDFASKPNKALAIPFSLEERELRRVNASSKGLLLDRYRLLAHRGPERDWLPSALRNDLVKWLRPRIDWLLDR